VCLAHDIPYRECGVLEAFAEIHAYNQRMAHFAREAFRERGAFATR
jgi:hypothetical protein